MKPKKRSGAEAYGSTLHMCVCLIDGFTVTVQLRDVDYFLFMSEGITINIIMITIIPTMIY